MSATVWILVVTLFTNDGDVLSKAMPVSQEDACMEAGGQVTHDIQGQQIPNSEGGKRLVLDAQFQCLKVVQQDHA